MEITKKLVLIESEINQISTIWDAEYPKNLVGRFIRLLYDTQNHCHYVATNSLGLIIGWAMVFNSDKMERFSILVSAENQNSGVGSRLIEFMKIHHDRLKGWVIDNNNSLKMNGEIYKSPIPFYLKHGFNIEEENRIDNELLNAVLISWQK